MDIKRLALTGFRNYEWETIDFSNKTNVISGMNAQGKTNLLEALYVLSYGKSFRSRLDRELINFDFSEAEILADVFSHDRDQTINIKISNSAPKKILVNSVKKKTSELAETINTVLFCPDDLNLIKEGAATRRKFLDNAISQIKPQYVEYLSQFNKLYENKTRILKDWREKPSLLHTLDEFSEGLCRCSAQIIRYRAAYSLRLQEEAAKIHKEFSGHKENLEIAYKTVSTVTDPTASAKEIYYQILQHQESHRQAEIESEQILTGAHKDDLEISINGTVARQYASQGQTRTAALSIKLAEREILLNETGEYPVLLLDDVLSELDSKRKEFVLNKIGGGQTIITCCEEEEISTRTNGKVFFVEKGKVR